MTSIRRLLRRHPGDTARLAAAAVLLVATRAALATLSFARVVELSEGHDGADRRTASLPSLRLQRRIRALDIVARRLFPGRPCLPSALVAHWLCRRSGHASQLRIGVRRDPIRGPEAHAWVEIGTEVVIGGAGKADDYAAASGFAALPSLTTTRCGS